MNDIPEIHGFLIVPPYIGCDGGQVMYTIYDEDGIEFLAERDTLEAAIDFCREYILTP